MAPRYLLLCPIHQWAATVHRIWRYAGATEDIPVSAVWRYARIEQIASKELVDALRAEVVPLGEDISGIKRDEIGTHLIRPGAAVMIYIRECPVYTIMMICR